MAISSVSLWPFPAMWICFIIPFDDILWCDLFVRGSRLRYLICLTLCRQNHIKQVRFNYLSKTWSIIQFTTNVCKLVLIIPSN
jgi:hypothetical protein